MDRRQLREFLNQHSGCMGWPRQDVEVYEAYLRMKEKEHMERQKAAIKRLLLKMADVTDDGPGLRVPEYCSQNRGDCRSCSLTSYGMNCINVPLRELDHLPPEEPEK